MWGLCKHLSGFFALRDYERDRGSERKSSQPMNWDSVVLGVFLGHQASSRGIFVGGQVWFRV